MIITTAIIVIWISVREVRASVCKTSLMRLPRESDYEGIILPTTGILVFQILDPVHEN